MMQNTFCLFYFWENNSTKTLTSVYLALLLGESNNYQLKRLHCSFLHDSSGIPFLIWVAFDEVCTNDVKPKFHISCSLCFSDSFFFYEKYNEKRWNGFFNLLSGEYLHKDQSSVYIAYPSSVTQAIYRFPVSVITYVALTFFGVYVSQCIYNLLVKVIL
jgi:hypothetical protein